MVAMKDTQFLGVKNEKTELVQLG